MKKLLTYISLTILILSVFILSSCNTERGGVTDGNKIVFAKKGEDSPFSLVYDTAFNSGRRSELNSIESIRDIIFDTYGMNIPVVGDYEPKDETSYEIIINSENRAESLELLNTLEEGEFAIKTVVTDKKTSIIIVYKGEDARMCAISKFVNDYVKTGTDKAEIAIDTDIREKTEARWNTGI